MKFPLLPSRLFCMFLAFILLNCSQSSPDPDNQKNQIFGVKIYDHSDPLPELFDQWKKLGINTVFVSASLDSNIEFRDLAKKNNIGIFIIVPVFYNPQALDKRPDLYAITNKGEKAEKEWVRFVCPSRADYREMRIQYIKNLIKELNPAGVSLDFIRFFAFWEKIYPDRKISSFTNSCFDTVCLDKFQEETGIKIPESLRLNPSMANWIIKNHSNEWTNWKCLTITSMVREIVEVVREVKPSIKINLHAVPWRITDYDGAGQKIVGQNLADLSGYVDFISPMCYHHMLKRTPFWIHDVVIDFFAQTKGPVLPSIQVSKAYLHDELSANEFHKALEQALREPSSGVIFWDWNAIAASPEKQIMIREILIGG